jgi:hypothetical protein
MKGEIMSDFICNLGYCPASVAPASAPMVGLDLGNNTVTRQVTPEQVKTLSHNRTCGADLKDATKITIEEPIKQGFVYKQSLMKVEYGPKKNPLTGKTSQRIGYCENRGGDAVNWFMVENSKSKGDLKEQTTTELTVGGGLIPLPFQKTITQPTELGRLHSKLRNEPEPPTQTKYEFCPFDCKPIKKEEYEMVEKEIPPHFVDGELKYPFSSKK